MSNPLLTLKNIGVTYKSGLPIFKQRTVHQALKDISFELYHGDSLGVIGRNGVGKSTLLKILNSTIKPDSGTFINHGYTTALLTLNAGFDGNVSGRNNAILNGMLLGLSKKEITEKLPEIIEFSELGKFIDEPVKNYSSGMRQRLGFAIATHVKSDILLIDEILSVGDIIFKKKSKKIMEQKLLSGDTVVLVSHSAGTIKSLCNKTLWIENGVVQLFGETNEVLKEYNTYLKVD